MAPPTTPSDSAVTQGHTDYDVSAAAAPVGLASPYIAPPAFYNPNAWAQQGANIAQALFDAQFPSGIDRIPTVGTGYLCGLYAIQGSIRASALGITVPTIAELQQVAQSPEANVSSKDNFYDNELARILHRWGVLRDLNLHLGFLQHEGPPMLSGLRGNDNDDAQFLWIRNDNAAPEGSVNPLGVLNHWSGVERRASIQANDSPDELASDTVPSGSTSGQSSSSQLTSSQSSSNQSSSSQSSSSESGSSSSSSSQSHSNRSTRAAPAGIPFSHSPDHTDSPQSITAQPAPSSPAVSIQALSQHPSPVATHSPAARPLETHSLEIEPASVQPEAATEPRRSNRVAKGTAKAETQPLDAQKLCPPHKHRYLCPIDGCRSSANSLADLNRYHRARDHASLDKFEKAETVDWLEWLAGRTCADVPAGTKTRYKRLLNEFLGESQSTLPSSASAATLEVGLAQVPVPPPQAKRSESGGDGQGQRPMQDLRNREKASDVSREPQQSVDNERGSSTSGGSSIGQKRKRTVGTDEDSATSPGKKPKLKLIVGPEKKLKLRLIVGPKSELRRLELETTPAAPTTATIQPPIPLPQTAQYLTPQNNALPGTIAAPGAPGSGASDSGSSETSHRSQSPRSADAPDPEYERVLTDPIPLALLDREQQAVEQKLNVRKAKLEAAGEDPVPGPRRKKLLKIQKTFDEQQKKDLGPVSFLDLVATELKGKYPDFATPLAEFEKVPDRSSAAPAAGKRALEWSRTDRELRNNLRSLFPPENQQPGFLSRAKDAVKAGHIVSTKVPKLRYRKKSTREHDLNWEDESLDNQLILAALTYIANLRETIGQLVREHETELAAAMNEQVTRLQSLPVDEASKVKHEEFLKALEGKNAEIAQLKKKVSLCVLAATAEREELEGMRDAVDDDRWQLGEERQDFEGEKAAFEEEKRKFEESKGGRKTK